MKTSVFCTNSSITLDSGGGIVCYNIIQALKAVTNLKMVLCGGSSIPFGVETKNVNPRMYEQPESPFLYDYFAASSITERVDIAQFYGAPFAQIIARLSLIDRVFQRRSKVIVDIAPHNIELSRDEHQHLGLPFPYPHLNNPNLFKLYMLHVELADLVIVHSKLSTEYLKQKLGLTNEIRVIPHGCYLPEAIPPLPETFTVAHVGVNGPDKGQIYLVKAYQYLFGAQWESERPKMLLAGYGTEALGGIGCIKDVNEVYKKCSVYVQPTVTEGFGIPVLEAMAHARPVIVTEGAGASELVQDSREGFVVPIRSPEAIAQKIRYFYDNPDEVKCMGINAREKAEQYTWEKISKQYEAIYLE